MYLTFDDLRIANMLRFPEFKNTKGELAHKNGISEWAHAQWLQAMVGQVGEYANLRKKFERGDIESEEFYREARKELADIQCYLDLLAARSCINLGEAVKEKFNEVSDRVDSNIFLDDHGVIKRENGRYVRITGGNPDDAIKL